MWQEDRTVVVIGLIMSVTMKRPQKFRNCPVTVAMVSFGLHAMAARLRSMPDVRCKG